MPRQHSDSSPKLRNNKRAKRFLVTLYDLATGARRDFALGAYGRPGAPEEREAKREAKKRYAALIAGWLARGRHLTTDATGPTDVTVNEALDQFVTHLERKCRRPDGSQTQTVRDVKITTQYLRDMFGTMTLRDFGADQLEQLRDRLIEDGRVTPQINKRVAQARQFYRWCLGRRLVPAGTDVWRVLEEMRQRAKAISPGEFGAKPGKIVKAADPDSVAKALPYLSPVARAIVTILRATGARPSEVCDIKPCELDRSNEIWELRPLWHKNARRGKARVIYFGEQAKAALAPWLLGCGPTEHVFSAARSEQKRMRQLREARETPLYKSHVAHMERKRVAKPKRKASDRYRPHALLVAIRRACEKAGVPAFTPYSLRHLKAVELRTQFGLEHARAVLGHSTLSMSGQYAAGADAALAIAAATAVG